MTDESQNDIRQFCLNMIKQTYGYDYNPDWHADLDSLLDQRGVYTGYQKGAWVTRRHGDEICAVGGLRSLETHTPSFNRFRERYNHHRVGALWRVYVDVQLQRSGTGSGIVRELEQYARDFGYTSLYLHTSWNNPAAVAYWKKMGYRVFVEDTNDFDRTVHMEKRLPTEL